MTPYTHLRFLFTISAILSVSSVTADYCWRDYNGTIPQDALIGGKSSGHNVYIGQAYIKNKGIFVVQIDPDVKEVFAPLFGVTRVDKAIKILCGHEDNFVWIPATNTNVHQTLLNKRPIIGGHEDDYGNLYIGKVELEDGAHIGKVNAFELESKLWRADRNTEKSHSNYKVLCYVD